MDCVGSLCLGVDWVRFHTQDLCEDGDRCTLIARLICVCTCMHNVCVRSCARVCLVQRKLIKDHKDLLVLRKFDLLDCVLSGAFDVCVCVCPKRCEHAAT